MTLFAGRTNVSHGDLEVSWDDNEFDRSCPNTLQLFAESVRKPLQNLVDGTSTRKPRKRRLTALEFSDANVNHLKIIKDMGISVVTLSNGRIQLLHNFAGVSF